MRAELDVRPDGTLRVREMLEAEFHGEYHGILRVVPMDYRDRWGFRYRLDLNLEGATDAQGNALRYETSRLAHDVQYRIYIPGATDAARTVVLTYKVENGLRYFADHDELYWNATGTEWPVPIGRAEAIIRLPAAASGTGLRTAAYTGEFGSKANDADVQVHGNEIHFSARHLLAARQGLTVVVGFPKGVVAAPSLIARGRRFLEANWYAVLMMVLWFPLPALLLLSTAARCWRIRHGVAVPATVMVRYEPPDQLTPGEAGTLFDNHTDQRDIAATLVDLAVRGFIRIQELKNGLCTDYSVEMMKSWTEWVSLRGHESELLRAIFGDQLDAGAVQLSQVKGLSSHYVGICGQLRSELESGGYYSDAFVRERKLCGARSGRLYKLWIVSAVLATIIPFLEPLWQMLGGELALRVAVLGFLVLPGRLILAGLGFNMAAAIAIQLLAYTIPRESLHGKQTQLGIRGFREFLQRAEKDYIERIQQHSELFDRYLPFAMALGVERHWASAFSQFSLAPPQWYLASDGNDGFHLERMMDSLNSFSRTTENTFTPPVFPVTGDGRRAGSSGESSGWSSSSDSGFSSSSDSGGGFGGGGGDAF